MTNKLVWTKEGAYYSQASVPEGVFSVESNVDYISARFFDKNNLITWFELCLNTDDAWRRCKERYEQGGQPFQFPKLALDKSK